MPNPLSIQVPFPVFTDLEGAPLENGYVYIGEPYLNPEASPIQVFSDAALSIPLAQPLRTVNGYLAGTNGTPIRAYIDGVNFSLLVRDKKGGFIFSYLDASGITSAGILYTPAGVGAVDTTVQTKLRERISVMDFGAVGDDATDCTSAFQAAIDYALTLGGAAVLIPPGTYFFAGTSASLDPGAGDIIFEGSGREATILHWEGSTTGIYVSDVNDPSSKALFKNVANSAKGNLTFTGLTVKGDWVSGRNGGGASMWLDYYDDITIRDCFFTTCATLCFDLHYLQSFHCEDNIFIDNARDCIRCRDTPNCTVTGNYILRNGDDAIALHTNDSTLTTWPVRSQMLISGNHIINGGSIKCLGGRRVVVSGNTMRFPNLVGIDISASPTYSEGNIPLFDINVSDNIISDLVSITSAVPASTGSGIVIMGTQPRGSTGTNSTIPGRYDSVGATFIYPWDYADKESDNLNNPVPPMTGIIVSGNILRRTAPTAVAFSDYGFGQRIFGGVNYNPGITDAYLRQNTGITFPAGGLKNARISNNIIEHYNNGVSFAAPTSHYDYTDVLVSNNSVTDCINRGIFFNTANYSVGVTFDGNTFDLDPYRKSANSNLDGSYLAEGLPRGIDSGDITGVVIKCNSFRNTCTSIASNKYSQTTISENLLYGGTVIAAGFNTAHKGIGNIPQSGLGYRYVNIDADPTSATYGLVNNAQYDGAAAQPASGVWVRGAFVKNVAPSLDANNMSILGWLRITTGSGNVAGTDWAVVRVSHVSPAV